MTAQALTLVDTGNEDDRILIGGLVAYAAHLAEQTGDRELSQKLESVFLDIAKKLPTASRKALLMMSHEIALRDAPPERVKLYLVKS
ncbi:MAG: hypothetical protein U1E67_22080 [Hyphomicrobiales bacterium]